MLSNNDGCIVSRSNEAKALGIAMGIPLFQVRGLIKRYHVAIFSSNFELYNDMSRRMMQTIASLVPRLEVYSIDETFADLSGLDDPAAIGRNIRRRVWQWVGIPACVGIAPSKTLAKLANHLAKRQRVFHGVCYWNSLPMADQESWLASLPVNEVWGIGRKLAEQLQRQRIHTILDLQRANPALIRKRYGVTVERIVRELSGRDCLQMEEFDAPQQQILRSRSFGAKVYDKADLMASIAYHLTNAASELRKQRCLASMVGISIRSSYYADGSNGYHGRDSAALPTPSADTLTLLRAAHGLLDRLYRPTVPYHKAGVVLSGLTRNFQPDLLEPGDTPQRIALMQTLDTVNERYGKRLLHTAAELAGQNWHVRLDHKSPCYTTRWKDLPRVRA